MSQSLIPLATEAARSNPVVGLPRMAAVIYHRRLGLFVGFNRRKTHPLQARWCKHEKAIHLHAEIDAIRQALSAGATVRELAQATLVVARVDRSGGVRLAKSCVGCQRAIDFYKIGLVTWTL